MPGRYRAASLRSMDGPKVRDAVVASPWLSCAFLAALAASTYGCVALTDLITPSGASRKVPSGADRGSGSVSTLAGMPDYVVGAIPFFFVMMAVEAFLLWLGSIHATGAQYGAVDTWSSLAAGTSQTLIAMLAKPCVPLTGLYCWVWDEYSVTPQWLGREESGSSSSLLLAAICVVGGDFCYYWFHRHAHEVHFLWAGHSVHHSSEHYNLSTALRQSWLQSIVSGLWSLPAALFLPPRTYMIWQQWVTLYQFWVHTCVVRRLPDWAEFLFVTPSHHRMHHDRRLHKNFAGVFIIWDRLFGTFQDEFADVVQPSAPAVLANDDGEEIAYFGIADVTTSWADAIPQLLIWEKIARLCARTPTAALRFLAIGPGFSTSTARRPLPSVCGADVLRLRADCSRVTAAQKIYASAHFAWTLYGLVALLLSSASMSLVNTSITVMILLVALTNEGLVYDQSLEFFAAFEVARCVLCIALVDRLPFAMCVEVHWVMLGLAVAAPWVLRSRRR